MTSEMTGAAPAEDGSAGSGRAENDKEKLRAVSWLDFETLGTVQGRLFTFAFKADFCSWLFFLFNEFAQISKQQFYFLIVFQ